MESKRLPAAVPEARSLDDESRMRRYSQRVRPQLYTKRILRGYGGMNDPPRRRNPMSGSTSGPSPARAEIIIEHGGLGLLAIQAEGGSALRASRRRMPGGRPIQQKLEFRLQLAYGLE